VYLATDVCRIIMNEHMSFWLGREEKRPTFLLSKRRPSASGSCDHSGRAERKEAVQLESTTPMIMIR